MSLTAGSLGDVSLGSSSLDDYCSDGEHIQDVRTLAERMPGLWSCEYNPPIAHARSEYQSSTPALELYLGPG